MSYLFSPLLGPDDSPSCPGSPVPSSWMNKTDAELRRMLQQAYSFIREKEKALNLAAELGSNLVNENEALKRKYDSLLKRQRREGLHRQSRRALNAALSPTPTSTPMTQPSAADLDSIIRVSSDLYSDPEENATSKSKKASHRLNTTGATSVSGRYEAERIQELEKENVELLTQIDTIKLEMDCSNKSAARKIRKLETDLNSTRQELERATERVTELEQEMADRRSNTPGTPDSRTLMIARRANSRSPLRQQRVIEGGQGEEVVDVAELKRKIADLEAANASALTSKRITNERLEQAQKELRTFKMKCTDLESRVRSLGLIEQEFLRVVARAEQLEIDFEEQRKFIRENLTPASTPFLGFGGARSPSLSPDLRKHEIRTQQEYEKGKNLMAELEMVLFKANQLSGSPNGMEMLVQSIPTGGGGSSSGGGGYLRGGHVNFIDEFVGVVGESVFGGASAVPSTSVDALGGGGGGAEDLMLSREEDNHSFFGLLRGFIKGMYRWFRFMMLLSAAVMLTVYRGPKQRIKAQGEKSLEKAGEKEETEESPSSSPELPAPTQ